jgi:hypothetical protein
MGTCGQVAEGRNEQDVESVIQARSQTIFRLAIYSENCARTR